MPDMEDAGLTDVEDAVAQAHRREWTRVLAAVVRTARDLDLAEEATQEAYVAALETWRRDGVPANPGAWLTTAARRKALDLLRREQALLRKLPLLLVPDEEPPAVRHDQSSAQASDEARAGEWADEDGAVIPDERLRLIFTCCHPALSMEARVALTLRMVCGLSTAEIARLFLTSVPTMAARLTRAKKKIRAAGIAYRVPTENRLTERLPALLAVLYLLFTAGHTATHGRELMRPELAARAIELLRMIVAGPAADDPEALALLALFLLTDARRPARTDARGEVVPLAEQDRGRWDRALLHEGLDLVGRALPRSRPAPGPYALQAAMAAVHAEARSYEETDWAQLLVLHEWLLAVHPSPVAALGRAVARSMVDGPEAGLAEIAELAADPRLASYHLLPAVRADLLRRLGRTDQAAAEYEAAVRLTDNDAERDFLRRRTLGMMKT